MTNATSAYPSSPGGVNFTDPREFYRQIVTSASLGIFDKVAAQTLSTAAGFFTEMGVRGVADDTNWTAATYKTLLQISSGSGIVMNLIGPTGLAGTPTTTFEVTLDGGSAIEVPVVATTTAQRAVLGATANDAAATTGTLFTVAGVAFRSADSISSDKTTQKQGGSDNMVILPIQTIRLFGTPCLIYRTSLLIRAKSSENNSTTTNQERQSAVQYMAFS